MNDQESLDVLRKFVEVDIRLKRTGGHNGYRISHFQMAEKHRITLPREFVEGKSVLDIGSCYGATGAWALSHGAKRYVGVEIQGRMVDQSRNLLQTYFPDSSWDVFETSFEEFLNETTEKFDIVIAAGVLSMTLNVEWFIQRLSERATHVYLEAHTPHILTALEYRGFKDPYRIPVTQYKTEHFGVYEEGGSLSTKATASVSIPALELLFKDRGFVLREDHTLELMKNIGRPYAKMGRYGVWFEYTGEKLGSGFASAYNDPNRRVLSWAAKNTEDSVAEYIENEFVEMTTTPAWKFDDSVAADFVTYARRHIPDYDRVIARCADLCNKGPKTARIIDVGCATGQTLELLEARGYSNLVGVDNSQSMLSKVKTKNVELIESSSFPLDKGPYDVILCNWTLHFINKKVPYLKDMFNGLKEGGFMVLTEKTQNDGMSLELYHDFKRSRGVTELEIAEKAESLKDVMFVDSVDFYLELLPDIGFKKVEIINASFCFTTFLVWK